MLPEGFCASRFGVGLTVWFCLRLHQEAATASGYLVSQTGGQDFKVVSFWEWQEGAGYWWEASARLPGDLFLGVLE